MKTIDKIKKFLETIPNDTLCPEEYAKKYGKGYDGVYVVGASGRAWIMFVLDEYEKNNKTKTT